MNNEEIMKAIHTLEMDRAYCIGAGYNEAAYLYGVAINILKEYVVTK